MQRNKGKLVVQGAMIAAMYAALTHLQNLIFPESASMMIQFRAAEALCVLAFFTKAAIPGLTVGCLLFNMTSAAVLPLDFLVGSGATLAATVLMWLLRNVKLGKLPLLGILMPALCNGLLVGWELSVYIGGGFWLNAACVAIGEMGVLLTLGVLLYQVIRARKLDEKLLG